MKLLVTGPNAYPWGSQGYGGVERLCGLLVEGLVRKGHKVIAACPEGSSLPREIMKIQTPISGYEEEVYGAIRENVMPGMFDFVLDMSHQHLLRERDGWPGISWIWHDPYVNVGVKFPKTGMMALSEWQQKRFQEREQLPCGVLDCHMVSDAYIYKDGVEPRDAWLWLGRLDKDKGAHIAATMFARSDQELLMVGPPMDAEVTAVVQETERRTEGRVRWLGEVSEAQKLELLQSCKGLWYWPDFAEGISEAHSMKTVEALCCGLPCLVKSIQPYEEVFGRLCSYMEVPEMGFAWQVHSRVTLLSFFARKRWGLDATIERIEKAIGAI